MQSFIPGQVRIIAAIIFALFVAYPVMAASRGGNDQVSAELVVENAAIRPGEPFWAGVRFKVIRGWHIYWRNPGDAGMATVIDWDLPPDYTVDSLMWPVPHRMDEPPTVSYGYEGEVLLMARITPPRTAIGTVKLRAHVSWLACKELCVAGKASLDTDVPVTTGRSRPNTKASALFSRTRKSLPVVAEGINCDVRVVADSITLTCGLPQPIKGGMGDIYFFSAEEGVVDHSADQRVSIAGGRLAITLHTSEYANGPITQLRGVLVRENGRGGKTMAIQVEVPVMGTNQ